MLNAVLRSSPRGGIDRESRTSAYLEIGSLRKEFVRPRYRTSGEATRTTITQIRPPSPGRA